MSFRLWHVILTGIVLLFVGGLIGRWIAILWIVFRAGKVAGQSIATLLEDAANQIADTPAQEWADWCLHLLKAVDIRVADRDYRSALDDIQAAIGFRLDTGGWPGAQTEADAEVNGFSQQDS
jgi:hypothetical protein